MTFPQISQEIARKIVAAFHQAQKSETSLSLREQRPLIFLSYAHSDERIVDSVEMNVRSSGLEPWVDRSRLRAGMQWEREIRTTIEQCSALVLLISPDSMRSAYVQFEFETALRLSKPIIGVIVKTCRSIPAEVRPYTRVDMRRRRFSYFLPVLYALQRAGILPDEITKQQESVPWLVLARGIMRAPLPDEQVFYARRMSRWSLIALFLIATGIVVTGILARNLVWVLYLVSLIVFPFWLNEIQKGEPELIIIVPTGIVQWINGRFIYFPFTTIHDWEVLRSSWMEGTQCRSQEVKNAKVLKIPARFHHHRQIAQRIIEACQRSPR
jgi:hypothetical protein